MEKISMILAKKGPQFHIISPTSSIDDVIGQMCSENVDYLIVMDDHERYLGIITEHDLASNFMFAKKNLLNSTVGSVMNKCLPTASIDDTVEHCMQVMRQHNIRYLPVFEHFNFKGIVSTDDILEEAVKSRTEIFDPEVRRVEKFGVLI